MPRKTLPHPSQLSLTLCSHHSLQKHLTRTDKSKEGQQKKALMGAGRWICCWPWNLHYVRAFCVSCSWYICWACLMGASHIFRGALSLLGPWSCPSLQSQHAGTAAVWKAGSDGSSLLLPPHQGLPSSATGRWSLNTGGFQRAWAGLTDRCEEDLFMHLFFHSGGCLSVQ